MSKLLFRVQYLSRGPVRRLRKKRSGKYVLVPLGPNLYIGCQQSCGSLDVLVIVYRYEQSRKLRRRNVCSVLRPAWCQNVRRLERSSGIVLFKIVSDRISENLANRSMLALRNVPCSSFLFNAKD
jgi:hypothetical protein